MYNFHLAKGYYLKQVYFSCGFFNRK